MRCTRAFTVAATTASVAWLRRRATSEACGFVYLSRSSLTCPPWRRVQRALPLYAQTEVHLWRSQPSFKHAPVAAVSQSRRSDRRGHRRPDAGDRAPVRPQCPLQPAFVIHPELLLPLPWFRFLVPLCRPRIARFPSDRPKRVLLLMERRKRCYGRIPEHRACIRARLELNM